MRSALLLVVFVAGCKCEQRSSGPVALETGLPRAGQWRAGFTLVDLDGNGTIDLVHGAPRKGERQPHVFSNDGHARFSRSAQTFPPLKWDYGDVVAAGDRLVFGVHLSGLRAVKRSDPGWQSVGAGLEDASFSSRALVAANDDDDPELEVFAIADGPRPGSTTPATLGVRRFDPTADGYAVKAVREEDRRFADAIAAGDLDGDGRADVATGSNTMGETRLVDFTGTTPAPPLALPERALVRAVVIANLDADAPRELVLVAASPVGDGWSSAVLRFDWLDGAWRSKELFRAAATLSALAAFDADGDGDLDLAIGDDAGALTLLFSQGNDVVSAPLAFAPAAWRTGCRVVALEGADLDGKSGDELVLALADEDDEQGACPSQGGFEILSQFPRDGRR
jgi:hypothetical protein